MLSTTSQFDTAFAASSSNPIAQLFIEHNWNSLADAPVASNNAGGDYDARLPISSVIRPRIPNSGMPYAVDASASGTDMDAPLDANNPSVTWRGVGPVMPFEYWIGPAASASGSPYTVANCEPQIDYAEQALTNKVEVVFDVSSALPTFDIQKKNSGGTWSTIITGAQPNATTGRYTAYRQSGGGWSTTRYLDNPDSDFYGIRIKVTNQDSGDKYVHVYGFGALLERDISSSIVSLDISKTRDESDPINPTGVIQTNTLSVELIDTAQNIMFGATDPLPTKDTKLIVKLGYDTSDQVGGSATDVVDAGTFFIDTFSFNVASMSISLDATDEGKFFQQSFMTNVLYENRTLQQICEDILYRGGFNNTVFDFKDTANDYSSEADLYAFPYVWFTNETTVWDALSEVLRAEQGIFYFREDGTLVITDLNHLDATVPALTLDESEFSGMSSDYTVEANDISVAYNIIKGNSRRGPARYLLDGTGAVTGAEPTEIPLGSYLWTPAETLSVGSTLLNANVASGATQIQLAPSAWTQLPLKEGEIKIEGEYITYENKRWDDIVAQNYVILDVVERGARNTTQAAHVKQSTLWNTQKVAQINHSPTNMTAQAAIANGGLELNLYGNASETPYVQWFKAWPTFADTNNDFDVFGTQITFLDSQAGYPSQGIAGIFMCENNNNSDGYYFELLDIDFVAESEWQFGNIRAYKADSNLLRTGQPYTEEGRRGYYAVVDQGYSYVVEVVREPGGVFTFYVNGTGVASFTDATYSPGRWGVYVRGNTKARFDYFVADGQGELTASDVKRGIHPQGIGHGSRFLRDYIENADFYDEFETVVHEVRTIDVEYNQYPAIAFRKVWNTNIWESHLLETDIDPFEARVVVENTGRTRAILNGEDDSFIAGELIGYVLAITGQVAVVDDKQTIKSKDDAAIRKRGRNSFELENTWIQSESRAKAIADAIKANFVSPVDFVSIDWFPNPALQPGDLVQLSYTAKGQAAKNYYVVESSLSYDGGFSGTLRLRYKETV